MAYEAALRKRPDPVISGRYGLVLMKLGHLESAAEALHAAFERGQRASAQERREVAAAYDKAKAATTWVNVEVSQVGATLILDGSPLSHDLASFWMFALPGEHTLHATLDGYEDVVETFTAKAGEEITVTLTLVPLPKPPTNEAPLRKKKREFPPHLLSSNVATDQNYSSHEDPYHGDPMVPKRAKKKAEPRFSVSGGVVTVFGVASWNPAVGAVVGVGLRPKEFLSLGLEGRAAWLTTPVAGREAISAMTGGGILSACGHLRWFFGCGLGYLGTVYVSLSGETFIEDSRSFVQPGVGARIGAQFPIGASLVVRVAADALRLPYRVVIGVGNRIIVDQPPFMLGAQVSVEWRFGQ